MDTRTGSAEPQTDYQKYRGKCKELSEAACVDDPTLTLVRGYYYDPQWGEQPHWWTRREGGSIHDPTKDQFPSKGLGKYMEFDGFYDCEGCGKRVAEADVVPMGRYACCS